MRRAAMLLLCLGCSGGGPAVSRSEIQVSLPRDQVDLLFMVDNSNSMTPGQAELTARFPALLQQFQELASGGQKAHYHIGVVTSDLGSGANQTCPGNGDGGRLQALGRAADASCQAPMGANFIDYDQLAGSDNLPAGQDLATTFGCMAAVGTAGCGFEQPLESVYRALASPPSENAGFLRDGALLVVVFVTNEDDCSVPEGSDLFEQQGTKYGPAVSYRCTRYGIVCGSQLMPDGASGGPLANCRAATPAEGGKLTDVQRYIDFFTTPGGVKANPADVLLASLAAPTTPVESVMVDISSSNGTCSTGGGLCHAELAHSCTSASNPDFYGDPAIRLSQVLAAAPHLESSICEPSYGSAMSSLGAVMGQQLLGGGCLPRPPADAAHPSCEVRLDGAALPACSGDGAGCWQLSPSSACNGRYRLNLSNVKTGRVSAACSLAD